MFASRMGMFHNDNMLKYWQPFSDEKMASLVAMNLQRETKWSFISETCDELICGHMWQNLLHAPTVVAKLVTDSVNNLFSRYRGDEMVSLLTV